MATENNSQINTFQTGLDSDSAISGVKDSSYTDARNIRILSYGENGNSNLKGVIKPINGIVQLDSVINDNVERILASGSIRQYGVIVYISETNQYPELCVATFTNKIDNHSYLVQQLDDLQIIFRSQLIDWPEKDKWPNRISISFKYESDNNVKMYMATGYNPIAILNLAHGVYDSETNLDTISSYPKVLFGKPKFIKYIAGSLKPAMIRYSYQLYNEYGVSTDISPACQSIPAINTQIDNISGEQFDKETNCGIQISIKSSKQNIFEKIKLYRITTQQNGQLPTIELIYDSNFNLDELGYFIFDDVGKNSIDKLSIEEYNSMSGVHIIPKAIESKDDILFAANIKNVQTCINEDKFKNWDSRAFRQNSDGYIILDSQYNSNQQSFKINELLKLSKSEDLICKEAYNSYNDINKQFNIDKCCVYDKDGYYGGTGINVSWRFIIYNTCIDSSVVKDGKEIGTLSNILNCKNIYSSYYEENCYFVHKDNGLVDSQIHVSEEIGRRRNGWITKSLRRNELYRYGIILYDKTGSPSPVKWIADIRTPNLYDKYFYTFISHYRTNDTVYDLAARNLGIAFKVDNLPSNCYGYEIVRCKRSYNDIATVSQGVISKPIVEYRCPATQRAQDNTYFPTGMLTTATVIQGSDFTYFKKDYDPQNVDNAIMASKVCQSNIANNNLFQFVSPEVCYQPDYMKTIFKNKGFKLEQLRYIFGCSAQSDSSDYDKITSSFTKQNIYYLKPSIGNTNYPISDNSGYKYIRSVAIPESETVVKTNYYNTQKFWIQMLIWLVKSIYYKANITDKQWSMRNPGVYNKYNIKGLSKASEMMNGIDLDVFAYIKLYEQGDELLCRSYNGYDDSTTYIKNQNYISNSNNILGSADIKSANIATDLKWNEVIKYTFEEKGSNSQTINNGRWWPQLEYLNHIDSVGKYQYCNAVFYGMNGIKVDKGGQLGDDNYTICKSMIDGVKDPDISLDPDKAFWNDIFSIFGKNGNNVGRIPYSTGGRCAILQLDDNSSIGFEIGARKYFQNDGNNQLLSTSERSHYDNVYINSIPGTSICNIRKTVVPYGGQTINAISSSTYYSCGQYFTDNNEWKAIFDGDIYISVLDYTSMHKSITNFTKSTDDAKHRNIWDYRSPSMMLGYAIPLESTINCRFSYGYEFSRNSSKEQSSLIQVQPSDVEGLYSQTDPEYVFNTAYASEDESRVHASYDYDNEDDFNKSIDARCMNSQIKEADEKIDSWSKFQSSNYIDVDSRYGQITNIAYYNNTLVFWQKSSTGILSVNDRSVVTDNNGSELILGSGGVLSRFDYLDETSGMEEGQFCSTRSVSSLYWFDSKNNEIKALQGKDIVNLGKQFNVQNILYKYKSNNFPVFAYDIKNNEIICRVLNDKQSLSYNEVGGHFQSIYTIPFDSSVKFDNGLYLSTVDNGKINIAQWDAYNKYSTTWGNRYIESYVQYVINKSPIITKVFDNQEIVSQQDEVKLNGDYYFDNTNHSYKWSTEMNSSKQSLAGKMTNREHNYRYAIPRSGNTLYGNRLRGKYLQCSISNSKPNTNISIQCIITKFRESCS